MNLLRPDCWAAPVADPLPIHGVAAHAHVRDALLRRILDAEDDVLTQLRGVASSSIAVLVGPTEALPWVDGALWLRRQPGEPRVLMPTRARCSVPATTLLAALLRRVGELRPPLVVLPDTREVVSLADALAPDRGRVRRLLAGGAP
jgi:hypothetical protein